MSKDNEQFYKPCIIAATVNDYIINRLIAGTEKAFLKNNIPLENQSIVRVKGALEIPLMLEKIAKTKMFNIYVVIAVIIRGETDHYEHVSRISHNGVLQVALSESLYMGNAILTVHNIEQALDRAEGRMGNMGFDAATAAINLKKEFDILKNKQNER